MGCLFACALQRAGLGVTLLSREPGAQVSVLLDANGCRQQLTFPSSRPEDAAPISHMLVTTKAYDVHAAVASVAHRLDACSQVVLLANGLGYADSLYRSFPHVDFYLGATTEGAFRVRPFHVRHAGRGFTRIGRPGQAEPPQWFRSWSQAVHPGGWDSEIQRTLWLKLALNCAINPLTALHRCRNGELARPPLAGQVLQLCGEIAPVCTAEGFPIGAEALHQQVREVVEATAANQSSMLQDVLAGRQTEADYITGYLLAAAHRHGLDVPLNEALLANLREHERRTVPDH